MWFNTKLVALASGAATGGSAINAFDNALRNAGIADFNLLRVSSIIPPQTPIHRLDPAMGIVKGVGRMIPAVYETLITDTVGETVAVGIGVGVPRGSDDSGVIFPASGSGTGDQVEAKLKTIIDEGMVSMRRVGSYDLRTIIAEATSEGPWTCVVAALLFFDDDLTPLVAKNLVPLSD